MKEQSRGPGRPKSSAKLTSSQKQSNYRQRCAARTLEMEKSVTFGYEVFLEIKNSIERVKNRYPERAGYPCSIERHAALFALEDLQRVLIDKSKF